MSPADEIDGVDFRPFFDMVVGILFVLLILIGALIFFQQAQDQATASAQNRIEDQRRRQQIGRFLDRVAGSLRDRGIAATTDIANRTVVLPLATVAALPGPRFVPALKPGAVTALGAAVADRVACVSLPRRDAAACPETDLLRLDALRVEVRLGPLPATAAVTQPEAARLLRNLISGQLLDGSLDLLKATTAAGERLVGFADGLSTAPGADLGKTPGPVTNEVPGDLALTFSFADAPP